MQHRRNGCPASARAGRQYLYYTTAGGAITTGWVLHDLARLAVSCEPYLAGRIIPGSLFAVAAGCVAGFACSLHRKIFPTIFILSGLCSCLTLKTWAWPPLLQQLPKTLVLLCAGAAFAHWLITHRGLRFLRTIVPIGLCMAGLSTIVRLGFDASQIVFFLFAAVVYCAQFLKPVPALAFLLAACIGTTAFMIHTVQNKTQVPRPGMPVAEKTQPLHNAPNLLLITLDTVRAQSLVPYGYHRNTTPALNRLLDEYDMLVYRQAYASSSWTLPSHASLFTGQMPGVHQADFPKTKNRESTLEICLWPAQPLGKNIPTLAEILADAGYHTAAIIGNCTYLSHQFGLDRGFQHYDARHGVPLPPRFTLSQQMGFQQYIGRLSYRDAETVTDATLRWLDTRREDSPFFLFVNYMDAHYPYIPPEQFDQMFGSARPLDPLAPRQDLWSLLYDRSLCYLDRHVTRLLEGLEERKLMNDTVIIIASDHGEAFKEHGLWGHSHTLYEEEIRVPLYVKPVRQDRTRNIDAPCTSTDLFTMCLQEIGIQPPIAAANTPVIAELYRSPDRVRRTKKTQNGKNMDRDLLAWFEADKKIIASSTGEVEIYDLSQDPDELHPVKTEETSAYTAFAQQWWMAHPAESNVDATHFDPQLLQRMRTLGYID